MSRFVCIGLVLSLSLLSSKIASGWQTTSPADKAALSSTADHSKTVRAGVEFLLQSQNREDGSFSKQLGPAVTAMCAFALLSNDVPADHPQVQKALAYVKGFVKADGGIYAPESAVKNYETSLAILAFKKANRNGEHDKLIADAVAFLKQLQWDDAEGHPEASNFFGGQGYGSGKRPDASNTSFFLEALQAVGEDADSTAIRNATTFMSRCQNLPSEHNAAKFAEAVTAEDRGGFIYSAVGKGESKAGETPEGGLRSYASMTYAGLKSFLYAGLKKDDPRVQAAIDWIRRHYDLKSNPGMGEQGLYYYYHVFAKALSAFGEPQFVDAQGVGHDWRADLTEELARRQRPDGSWVNATDRWYESDP
ncbi:MAG: prenyltransferase/squalene oxidase repeat-containing protein, partial [Planctomycetota bacterium]